MCIPWGLELKQWSMGVLELTGLASGSVATDQAGILRPCVGMALHMINFDHVRDLAQAAQATQDACELALHFRHLPLEVKSSKELRAGQQGRPAEQDGQRQRQANMLATAPACPVMGQPGSDAWRMMGNPEIECWNGIDRTGARLGFGDGGGLDNAGSPLRRREPREMRAHAHDVTGLFGAIAKGAATTPPPRQLNARMQVFDEDKLVILLDRVQAQAQHDAGRGVAVRMTLDVLPNMTVGIAGGYSVETLWVFNAGEEAWLAALPPATRELLRATDGFPRLPSMMGRMDYNEGQLSAWSIFSAEEQLADLLGEPLTSNPLSTVFSAGRCPTEHHPKAGRAWRSYGFLTTLKEQREKSACACVIA
eukprot:gene35705-423_t